MTFRRPAITVLALLAASLVDGSVLTTHAVGAYLSCTLAALTLVLFLSPTTFFPYLLAAGFLAELYTGAPFGVALGALTVAGLFSWWSARHFITNRTPIAFFSLAVVFVVTHNLLIAGGVLLLSTVNAASEPRLLSLLAPWQVLGSTLLALALSFFLGAYRMRIDPAATAHGFVRYAKNQ